MLFVDDEILEQNDESAFRCADGEEEIDHPDDVPITPQDKNASAARLFENQAQAAKLFILVRAEIAFFAEEFAEQSRQLVEIFGYRRLDDYVTHRQWLFHNRPTEAMRFTSARLENPRRRVAMGSWGALTNCPGLLNY